MSDEPHFAPTIPQDRRIRRRGRRACGGVEQASRRRDAGRSRRRPDGPHVLRHLLLEVQCHRPRARRPAVEDHRQPGRSAVARPALPARHRRRRRALRPRSPAGAAACGAAPRRGGVGRRSPGTRRWATSPSGCRRSRPKYGPEAVALFSHGIGGTFLKHTLKAYGITNSAAPSFAQCRGPRDVGFELTFGEGIGSPERTDIRNARCLVLVGSHLGENMHNTQVQEFAEAIGNGATHHRGGPALLGRGQQGEALPAGEAGHGPCADPRLDERPGRGEPLRRGLRRAVRLRLRQLQGGNRPVHARVGLPGDRHRARRHPRDGAGNGAASAGHAGAPGPARDLVRRRRAAQPRASRC